MRKEILTNWRILACTLCLVLCASAEGRQVPTSTDNGLLETRTLGSLETSRTRNLYGEVMQWKVDWNGTPVFVSDVVREGDGKIVGKTESCAGCVNIDEVYEYDAMGRLLSVDDRLGGGPNDTYTYDDNGNRTSGRDRDGVVQSNKVRYDERKRLREYGKFEFDYADWGPVRERRVGNGNPSVTFYEYDYKNNLRTVALPSGKSIEYIVDGLNRRVGKRVDGVFQEGFLYQDALEPIAWLDANGDIQAWFIYGSIAHTPDVMLKRDGSTWKRYGYVTDHQGSVRLVIDLSNGSIAQELVYDAFGRVEPGGRGEGFQPFGYVGGINDLDTGLVKLGVRDYDPSIGRWMSPDPSSLLDGPNLYSYAASDPINLLDTNGLFMSSMDAFCATDPVSCGQILASAPGVIDRMVSGPNSVIPLHCFDIPSPGDIAKNIVTMAVVNRG